MTARPLGVRREVDRQLSRAWLHRSGDVRRGTMILAGVCRCSRALPVYASGKHESVLTLAGSGGRLLACLIEIWAMEVLGWDGRGAATMISPMLYHKATTTTLHHPAKLINICCSPEAQDQRTSIRFHHPRPGLLPPDISGGQLRKLARGTTGVMGTLFQTEASAQCLVALVCLVDFTLEHVAYVFQGQVLLVHVAIGFSAQSEARHLALQIEHLCLHLVETAGFCLKFCQFGGSDGGGGRARRVETADGR